MLLPDTPSVLLLLVASDGAQWLPDVLRGVRAQKHRPLNVLAVDNASTDGSGDLLAKAFGERRVVTLERRVGYGRALAAALKVAADRGVDADAFLLLHDDTSLEPGAIEAMIEAMRAEGVGIVGAKLVDWDDPTILQDIGQTTDRYGRAVPRVERGEIDQGQHDGVHDVLYATSAALMVARPVVEKVGLFDLRYVSLRDDFDLCWRARLAGWATVVTTQASARHAAAGVREVRSSPTRGRIRYFGDRNMIATLIKNYGLPRLAVALPVTIGVSMANALLYLARGRRRSALQVLEAIQWNVVHLAPTLRARVRAQRNRRVPDSDVTRLMHHGATRLRAQLEGAFEKVVGEIDEGERTRPSLAERARAHPGAVIALVTIPLLLLGSRTLLGSGALAGVELAPFPDRAGDLFREFSSGLRGAGAGGAGPATPGLLLLGIFSFLCFGSGWLAQRVLLVGLPLAGALATARLARTVGAGPAGRRVAGVAYAATPLVLGTYGAGRLPDLVLLAAAPLLLQPLVRAAFEPKVAWRTAAAGSAILALATALAPWSLPLAAGGGVVLAAAAAGRGDGGGGRTLRTTATMVAGAVVLLLPWSVELFRIGSPLGGGGADPLARMTDVLGFSVAAVRPIPRALLYGVPLAGAAAVLLVRDERRAPAVGLGALAFAGTMTAWAVARGVPWIAPRPALPLVVSAVAVAALAGLAVEATAPRLRARAFGLGHVLAAVVGFLVAAQVVFAVGWIAGGRHPGIVSSGSLAPSFLASEATRRGAFRIAWVGGSDREPTVSLTGPEGKTIRQFLERSGDGGAEVLRRIAGSIVGGATESGGRMLATLGVRYVVVRPDASPGVADAFARQIDLAFAQRFRREPSSPYATIYQNEVALPVAASVGARAWVAASEEGLDAAAGAEPSPGPGPGFARPRPGELRGTTGSPVRAILLAEGYGQGWKARVGGTRLDAEPSFGWAVRFPATAERARARVYWTGQLRHRAALVGEALLLVAFSAWWSRRAARERGER